MTLIFNGNSFKYELEAVVKLFFPAQLFDFAYEQSADSVCGDFCVFTREIRGDQALLSTSVSVDGKNREITSVIPLLVENYENECELQLARSLYKCLSELTGKQAKWGILTGVRPVKRVNGFLENGLTKQEITNCLKEEFLVNEQKADIAFRTATAQANALKSLEDNSFSLYVNIPFCPSRCSYCSFVSQEIAGCLDLIPNYVYNLCRELRYTAEIVQKIGLKLDTVYFGGGTPTTLSSAHLEVIMQTIAECFDTKYIREYTVEAGRADTITLEKLETIRKNGAERVSINPQTLNNSVLKAIGRNHTAEEFFQAYKMAKSVGFASINTDLIAGLTNDTPESFMQTVDGIIDLSPDNITVHTLSIKRTARLNRESETVLGNPAEIMVDYAEKRLSECGYEPYYLYRQKNMLENLENIGWTKPNKESLYNIYIMEEVQTIIAVGAGASTKLCDRKNGRLERIFNFKLPLEYNNNFEKMLARKDEILKFYNY